MRLTGIGTRQDLTAILARARGALDPWLQRAGRGLERLAPYRERIGAEVRKRPRLAAGMDAVGGTWTRLVTAFCGTIDPVLTRFFPDLRLVALVDAASELDLHQIAKTGTTSLGPLSALSDEARLALRETRWTAVELRLRPEHVLQRSLSLPAASRDFLAPIIEHKIERLTPWRPDRVLYGYRPLAGTEAAGAIAVALTATSKDIVAAPLKLLADAGLVPTAIGAAGGALAEPLEVNMVRGNTNAARVDSRQMVSRIALATFGLLGAVYLGSSLWAASAADGADEANVRLLKARRLLKSVSMGGVGDREQALFEAKQPERAVVVLIDKLAEAIPQDTYLKELAVTPDKVRIVGTSANAPALVGEIEATGLLNVRFTSAITREKDNKDSFEITADRAGAPAAASP